MIERRLSKLAIWREFIISCSPPMLLLHVDTCCTRLLAVNILWRQSFKKKTGYRTMKNVHPINSTVDGILKLLNICIRAFLQLMKSKPKVIIGINARILVRDFQYNWISYENNLYFFVIPFFSYFILHGGLLFLVSRDRWQEGNKNW